MSNPKKDSVLDYDNPENGAPIGYPNTKIEPQHMMQQYGAPIGTPVGYNDYIPNANFYYYGQPNHNPHMVQQATTHHPYQSGTRVQAGADWDFNVGTNKNLKGEQTNESIEAFNGATASAIPHGRVVMNTGNNHNEGDKQVNGGIEFGNAMMYEEASNQGAGRLVSRNNIVPNFLVIIKKFLEIAVVLCIALVVAKATKYF